MRPATYEEKFQIERDNMQANEAKFRKNAHEIDRAYADLQRHGPPENIGNAVAPNAEHHALEKEKKALFD